MGFIKRYFQAFAFLYISHSVIANVAVKYGVMKPDDPLYGFYAFDFVKPEQSGRERRRRESRE